MPPPNGNGAAQRGIQSIEVGGALLRALADRGQAMALKDLAAAAGMSPAKAHPYLVSFGKLGLVEQQAASGRYGLGPLAMQLGLISLQQLDPIALATPVIESLAATTGLTAAIAVWGNRGATIVRVAHPATPVHVSMRHGTVMSLRVTASGRLFAAWLPRAAVLPVLKGEGQRGFDAGFSAELEAARVNGYASAVDLAVAGVSAVAAPVFDAPGRIALALTVIGPGAALEVGAQSRLVRQVKGEAEALSRRLAPST